MELGLVALLRTTVMDDLSRFGCQNRGCPDHGQRGQGNLTVCARYGPHQRRLLYCTTCKARQFAHLLRHCSARPNRRLSSLKRPARKSATAPPTPSPTTPPTAWQAAVRRGAVQAWTTCAPGSCA